MTPAPSPEGPLSAAELLAVAALWKKTRREVVARFTGRSMEPSIPSGTEVRLGCGEEPEVGEVVAFVRDGHVIVHRVVGRAPGDGWILTRGDAFVLPDPPVEDPATILGPVTGIRAGEGFAPPPPVRDGAGRRLVLGACLALLRGWPRGGSFVIRALRLVRPAVWRRRADSTARL